MLDDIFGKHNDIFHLTDRFQNHLEAQKQKEKELKNIHSSILKKNYINGYQNNTSDSKNFSIMDLIDNDDNSDSKGDNLMDKIGETLESTKEAEKNIDIPNALQGIQNGLQDLDNLQKLNDEEGDDIRELLKTLKSKYQTVNQLVNKTKNDFTRVEELKTELSKLDSGDDRNNKEKDIKNLETNLKNTKGCY